MSRRVSAPAPARVPPVPARGALVRRGLAEDPGHRFYRRLNEVRDQPGFDECCEAGCQMLYHKKLGQPSLAPGICFRVSDQTGSILVQFLDLAYEAEKLSPHFGLDFGHKE